MNIPFELRNHTLKYIFINFGISKKEIKEYEIKCLELLNYNLSNPSSYSILSIILNNGIISENENKNLLLINKIYQDIINFHFEFVRDLRFLDFTNIDIAISIVSYVCKENNLHFWKNSIKKFYLINKNINNSPCYFIIDR